MYHIFQSIFVFIAVEGTNILFLYITYYSFFHDRKYYKNMSFKTYVNIEIATSLYSDKTSITYFI